ncbi:MAG: DNA repair exonuclease [Gemmatimonadaceae bacterium]
MRFIHCSDLHLDSPLLGLERYPGVPAAAMRAATRGALENLVRIAIEQAVDLVAIAGDVFDGNWPDFNSGLFFASRLARLREADIRVVLVRGNHDAESQITKSLRLPDNVTILDHKHPQTITVDNLGLAVHGQSFADRAVPNDLAAAYPEAIPGLYNIGMLHTSMGGYPEHATYAPTTLDVLRSKGYDYWALGHVHARAILAEHPRVVFSGNTQGRHARELGPKGCELVTVDESRATAAEFVELDVVRWTQVHIDIAGLRDLDALIDSAHTAILEAHHNAADRLVAVRVALTGVGALHSVLASDPEKVIAELRATATDATDGAAWIEKIAFSTRPAYDRDALARRDDPIAELLRLTRAIEAVPANLEAMAHEALDDLVFKLPPEARSGEGALRLDDPERLRALLDAAEGSLLALLSQEGTAR